MISIKLKTVAILVAFAGTSAMSAPQTAPQAKTCQFFEDFNYQGAHFGLYTGDMLATNAQVNPQSVFDGGLKGRKFVDPKWAARVSSLKVPKGCMAIVYNGKDRAVGLWQDLAQFTPQYNDKGVGFGCHCK